jgi:hypothetical protein
MYAYNLFTYPYHLSKRLLLFAACLALLGAALAIILVGIGSSPGSHCIEQEQPALPSMVCGYIETNEDGDLSSARIPFLQIQCLDR